MKSNTLSQKLFDWFEQNRMFIAIRQGLIMVIPILLIGSFSILMQNFPIPVIRNLIENSMGGIILHFFALIDACTFHLLSIYIVLTISYSYAETHQCQPLFAYPLVSLLSFFIISGFEDVGFSLDYFGVTGIFAGLLTVIISCSLFDFFKKHSKNNFFTYTHGADSKFNDFVRIIFPACGVLVVFVLFQRGIVNLFHMNSLHEVFSHFATACFQNIGHTVWGGLCYLIGCQLLWFFGVHGSNVLEVVSINILEKGTAINEVLMANGLQPTEIISKGFIDTFAVIGGSGATLALLIVVFFFARNKNLKNLAKFAAIPVFFNINELLVFGLPIVLNPVFLIPYILSPVVCLLNAYFATVVGFIPPVSVSVKWTTPVIISGYMATGGTIQGSIVQIVNVILGILIYFPFVRIYEKRNTLLLKNNLTELVKILREEEELGVSSSLLTKTGTLGNTAKMLSSDLQYAIKEKKLELFYQPQTDAQGEYIGAEALLRWNHPICGFIYPPLLISLAREEGYLFELESYVFHKAVEDVQLLEETMGRPYKISVNLTADTLMDPAFDDLLLHLEAQHHLHTENFWIEITEGTALSGAHTVVEKLKKMQDKGYKILIDDFGMGHTSLVYLQEHKFAAVKLDGSLTRDVIHNQTSREIISSIQYLSRTLNFLIIAEYVETAEQKEVLEKLGCSYFQGYYISKPVPYEEFIAILKN